MIKLTITSEVLKDEVDKKIKELTHSSNKGKKDHYGKTAEWYIDMDLDVPEELEESDSDRKIEELTDDDANYDKIESMMFVRPELIELIIDGDEKEPTSLYLGNKHFSVKETAAEVYDLITAKEKSTKQTKN